MRYELVEDWMTTSPITVTATTTLPEAQAVMIASKIRRLPVVDTHGYLIGIVTIGDIRASSASPATTLSIWEMNQLLSRLKVKEIMTKDPISVAPNATIGRAARLMLEHKISGLPVVDHEQGLVGILTESDIFEMVVLHEWQQLELN